MNISVSTKAVNGQLILFIIDSGGLKIMELRDTATRSTMLIPGSTYRFEWHVWSPLAADYTLLASVTPENSGFPIFNPPTYHYAAGKKDMGGFYFTV